MKQPACQRMVKKTLKGKIETGCGDAKNWEISEIRKVTGYSNLREGTLSVRLASPHNLRPDYRLRKGNRTDGRDEDLFFESCLLVIRTCRVRALIARTSTNYWGPSVLEIMAEETLRERYCLQEGDNLEVEVRVEARGRL